MYRSSARVVSAMLALVLTACAGATGSPGRSTVVPTPDRPSEAPSLAALASATAAAVNPNLVSIGDRSLWLECTGEGSPTIVMESGLGGDHRTWDRVAPELSAAARV